MKRIFFIMMLLLWCRYAYPQTIYPIRADTVRIYTGSTVPGAGGELLLQNGSMGVVNGLLTNTNARGNTVFRKLVLNYTPNNITGGLIGILGQDTINIPGLKPYMDTMYLSGGNLLYQKNGNTYTVVLPSSGAITADNFLTKTGNNIQLGGNAITNTTLSALLTNFKITGTDNVGGTSVFELNGSSSTGFQQVVNRGTTASGFNNFYNTFDINSGTIGGTNTLIRATPTLAIMQLSNATLNTNFAISTGASTFNDGINSRGISYGNNYAANNTVNDRWLPDKRYVDSVIGGITPNNIYTTNGSLTGNRVVDVLDYNLTFRDLDSQDDQTTFVFSRSGADLLLRSNYYFGDISPSENAESALSLGYSQYALSGGGRFYSSSVSGDSTSLSMRASQTERKLIGFQYNTTNYLSIDTLGMKIGRERYRQTDPDTVRFMTIDTAGTVSIPYYKNNITQDSVLTVDPAGNMKLILPNTGLMRPLRITTSTTTLAIQEYYLNCNNTTDIVVNLPPTSPAISGKSYIIKKVSTNINTVTINPGVGVTIDDDPTVVLSAFKDYVIIYTDGVNWWLSSPGL
jgi:hypothetical protein